MGLARRLEKRAVTYQDYWGKDYESSVNVDATGMMWYGPRTFAGINVTQERALRATAVWACVSLISESVAALPWEVHRVNGDTRTALDLPGWLAQPHPEITRFDWLHRVMTSLLLDGNAYIYIGRGDAGQVVSLTPVHPYRVRPRRDDNNALFYVIDGDEDIPASDMLHIAAFTRPGDLKGLSPIECAKESIGLSLVAEEFGARFFGQGASMSGVLETGADLTDNAAKVMASQFQEKHGGSRKAHLPLVLTAGTTWKQLSIAPNDAQFLETRHFQTAEIARIFRVPLHMIQELDKSTSWGAGIEQQAMGFLQYTLLPWLVRIEESISRLLPGKQQVKFDVDAMLRATMKDRYDAYQVALTNGFMNKDEVRQEEGLPPIADGSGTQHLQPANTVPSGHTPQPDDTPSLLKALIAKAGSSAGDGDTESDPGSAQK